MQTKGRELGKLDANVQHAKKSGTIDVNVLTKEQTECSTNKGAD
jgi:hypothetical protein